MITRALLHTVLTGNGYVRAEGVMAVYVCKRKDAKRVYGTVVTSATNNDGGKDTSKCMSFKK